jgi:uncharacterized protein YfaS (alpha-2-macroglobulin family)/TolA-binding protein
MKLAGCFVVILGGMVVSASLAAAEPQTEAWPVDTPQVPVRIRTLLEDRDYPVAVKAIDEAALAKEAPLDYLAYLKGWALYLAKRYDAAVAALDLVDQEHPKSRWARRARFAKGMALARKGDFRRAELIFRAEAESLLSAERRHELASIYLEFADAHFKPKREGQKPDYEKALEFYSQALEVGPKPEKRTEVALLVAQCHQNAGRAAEAAKLYAKFSSDHPIGPWDLEARYRLGECHLKEGNLKEARRVWQDLLAKHLDARSERIPEALYQVARTWRIPEPQNDEGLSLGVAALDAFCERFPTHKLASQAHLERAKSYVHQGRHEDAAAGLKRFLDDARYRDRKELPEAWHLLGTCYRAQKRFTEALAVWREYLTKFPTHEAWNTVQKETVDTEYAMGLEQYKAKQYDAAVKLLTAFLAKYPLDARNQGILFLFGQIQAEQKKYDAAIAEWRRLVSKHPDTVEASHARLRIAATLEQGLGKLDEAVEAYRKLTAGPNADEAQKNLARLTEASLAIATDRVFRSDETPRLRLTTRNIESVTVRVYKVDMETYFRKMHRIGGIEQLDISLIDPDRTFEFTVPSYAKYRQTESQIEVPVPGGGHSGVMAVTVSSKTLEATTLLLESDLDVILKASRDEVFVLAENMRTGKPWPGVRLLISDGVKIVAETTTDAQGIGRKAVEAIRTAADVRVFAMADGNVASNESPLLGAVGKKLTDRGYLYTDMPVYPPGGRVHVRGCVRQASGDAWAVEKGKKYTLSVIDSRARLVHEAKVKLGPFGSFDVAFTLPSTCLQGDYRIGIRDEAGHTYAGRFLVQQFTPELVRLTIETPRRVYYRGEEIEGTIRATYYDGVPVVGRAIQYRLAQEALQTAKTDEKGEVRFKLPTREFAETQTFQLSTTLAELHLHQAANLFLTTKGFDIAVSTMRPVFLAGEPFEVAIKAKDAEGRPVAEKLTLRVFERTKTEQGEGERLVEEYPVQTAADGTVRHTLKLATGARYTLRAEGIDRFKNPISGQTFVQVSDEKDRERLRILANQHAYRAGDTAGVIVHWREKPALALVTFEGNRVFQYQLTTLQTGPNKLAIPMAAGLAPNFDLAVAVMTDRRETPEGTEAKEPDAGLLRFHTASTPFTVQRDLNVTLACRRSGGATGPVRPGEPMDVTVTTTDPLGKPVAAEVSLAMVHQAIVDRFDLMAGTIREAFQGPARESTISTVSSITFNYRPKTCVIQTRVLVERERVAIAGEEEASRGRASADRQARESSEENDLSADQSGGRTGTSGSGGDFDSLIELITSSVHPTTWESPRRGRNGQGMGGMGGRAGQGRNRELADTTRVPQFSAASNDARPLSKVFEQVGYWNPAIVTDQNGKATVTLPVPDEATAWTLVAKGITADTLVGEAVEKLVVRKDLYGQMKLPAAFTEGDHAEVVVAVHNHLVEKGPIAVALKTTIAGQTVTQQKTLDVQGKGIREVTFKTPIARPANTPNKASEPGEDLAAAFELTVRGAGMTDVVRRTVPVLPYGAPVYASASGVATTDTTAWVEFPKDLPVAARKLQVIVGPTIEQSLLEIVRPQPQTCTAVFAADFPLETATSDLMAALALQRLLGVSREAGGPVAEELDARIRAVLGVVMLAQKEDGVWSWTGKGEGSDRFRTARIVWALSLARKAGYPVDDRAFQKAVDGLRREVSAATNEDYESRAILLHALTVAGAGDFAVANHLHRERLALSTGAMAYLALTLVEMDRKAMAGDVLTLLAHRNLDGATPRHGIEQQTLPWSHSPAELRALYALASQAVAPEAPKTKELVDWLLAHRTGLRWSPDKATGPATLALCQWFAASRFEGQRYQLAILVNDQPVTTLDVEPATGSRVIDVPTARLGQGKQKVQIQLTGRARYSYQCLLSGFVPADKLKNTSSDWEVTRVYEAVPLASDGREVPRGFDVVQGKFTTFRNPFSQLPMGEKGVVELQVRRQGIAAGTPKEHLQYLIVTEPVPAGAAVIPDSVRGGFERFEIVSGGIQFYVGDRPKVEPIHYELRGYLPGEYRAAPTLARNAYHPEQMAVASAASLTVLPLGTPSGDKYRLSPRELYELGQRAAAKGDWKTAGQQLTDLVEHWNLKPDVYQRTVEMLLDVHLELGPPEKVVHYFEIVKERWPSKEIPFAKILKVGAAYHEIGEFERSYLVFRATIEGSFARECSVASFLESQDEFQRSVQLTERFLSEYPPEGYVAETAYSLAQQVNAKAPEAANDPKLRERKINRVDLIHRAWGMLDDFLTAYPEDPAADQAAFGAANALLQLEDYQGAAAACQRCVVRYPKSGLLDSYWYMIGYCQFALGKHQEALATCRKVAEMMVPDKTTGLHVESRNKWRAIYILGQIHHSLGQLADAIREYRRVEDRFPDAKLSIAHFLRKAIELPEVTTVKPGSPVELELKARNLAACDVKVYRIDLMKFSLLKGDLGGITRINLAGIRPLHEAAVELGDGRDYRDRTHKLPLPLAKEGAYLVVVRGENLYTSGLVLITSLGVEVQTEPGSAQVRVMVKDTVADRYLSGVQVRVIGSQMDEFVSGKTDLRGVFVAEQVFGPPTVIALADGGRYAFFRSPHAVAADLTAADSGRTPTSTGRGDRSASPRRPTTSAPIDMGGRGVAASSQRIREALAATTDLQFVETPLADVVERVKRFHQIEIQVDQKALADMGIDPDTPVTRSLKDISLRTALRLMLRDLDLTYVIQDEVLLITTPEKAETMLTTVVYPVADLLKRSNEDGADDFDSLIGTITSTVLPTTWDEVGGPGSIAPHEDSRSLVVSQTQEVHERIASVLEKLRKAAGIADGRFPSEGLSLAGQSEGFSLGDVSESTKKILKALNSPTQLEFIETPLHDVVSFLKDYHGIEIQIDRKALDDVGIGSDTPITRDLKGITLRSALQLMLRDLDLTYVIQDEVLLITTPEQAETRQETVVYPVGDLVAAYRDASGQTSRDFDSLIELITTTIQPTTWDEVGGPGSIDVFENGQALVLTQTGEVHNQLAAFLATLRRAGGGQPADGQVRVRERQPREVGGMGMGMGGGMGGMGGGFGSPSREQMPHGSSRRQPLSSSRPAGASDDLLQGLQDVNRQLQDKQVEKHRAKQKGMGGSFGGMGAGAAF